MTQELALQLISLFGTVSWIFWIVYFYCNNQKLIKRNKLLDIKNINLYFRVAGLELMLKSVGVSVNIIDPDDKKSERKE